MSVNETVPLSLATELTPVLFISWEIYDLISRVCYYVVYPCIGLIGIFGNILNIIILIRKGFRKSSSILLLSLAVSDCLLLIGVNNFPRQVYADYRGFRFSETLNYVCFVLYMFCFCATDFGSFSSVFIPVLITGERILAIFFPFQAYVILTPRRTVIVMACLYIVDGICCLYAVLLNFQLKNVLIDGIVVSFIRPTDMRIIQERSGVKPVFDQIVNYMTGVVPISLVTVGCVVIGLRIVQITNRRRQLTSSQVTASSTHGITKTTKTLLKICLLYIACYGSTFIVLFILQGKLLEQQSTTQSIIERCNYLVLSLNCVGNCMIYLGSRQRFRKSIIVVLRKLKQSR